MTPLTCLGKKPFQNTVGKGENAGNHNVFFSIKDRYYDLCYIYFVVCKCIQFGQSQIFVVWEWVNT